MNPSKFATFLVMLTCIVTSAEGRPSRSRVWLERPWDIRYLLFISDTRWSGPSIRVAQRVNARDMLSNGKVPLYLDGEGLFLPSAPIAAPGRRSIVSVLLTFDTDGRVISNNILPARWVGRRNVLNVLALIDEDHPMEKPYAIADWDQGIPGSSFSPAVCGESDMDRYVVAWNNNFSSGGFGCREWTAQLYDRDQPYIDVTSYASTGSFIGEFVGWARFSDPPKPVIGRHGRTWLCLHDCPAGEKVGPIPDINAWVKKHGFPPPTKPRRQPIYPNSKFKNMLDE